MHARTEEEASRALEVISDALTALPDPTRYANSPTGVREHRADFHGWIIAHGGPAVRALSVIRRAVRAQAAAPGPLAITLACVDPAAHTTTPTWDFHRRAYFPRRPAPAMVRQVAEALVAALGRPVRPREVWTALMAPLRCSRTSARRAVRDALDAGLITADRDNRIVPGPVPPAGLAARETEASA